MSEPIQLKLTFGADQQNLITDLIGKATVEKIVTDNKCLRNGEYFHVELTFPDPISVYRFGYMQAQGILELINGKQKLPFIK